VPRRNNRDFPQRRRKTGRDESIRRDRVRQVRSRLRRGAGVPEHLAGFLGLAFDTTGGPGRGTGRGTRGFVLGTGMRSLRPVPWTALKRGVVVDAFVPFEDGTGYKRRPAVVLRIHYGPASYGRRICLIPVTSRVSKVTGRPWLGTVISRPGSAGLRPEPSAMLWRPVVVERIDFLGVVGALAEADLSVLDSWLGRTRRRPRPRSRPRGANPRGRSRAPHPSNGVADTATPRAA
jgi:hypothetical protein